ncbi:MAG: hypothetical protein DRP79_01775 [Planctomycetota bacterium]|nr:MAG: hypothetical protein DRP79_01775 [Planctomycetota bacterium]
MTNRDKKESGGAGSRAAERAAGLFEYMAVILVGIVITLRPVLPGHALASSRNLLLHALIVVAGFLWLAAQCLHGRIRIGRCGIGIPLIVYALVIGVSPLFAAYKYAALQSLPIWLTNLLLFFMVFNLSRNGRVRGFFVAVLLAAAAVVVFYGIYQRFEGLEELRHFAERKGFLESFDSSTDIELARARLEGNEPSFPFTTSNILATFLLITVPVFFGAGVESLRNSVKGGSFIRAAVTFFAAGAGLVCLYLTGSRAAYVVFAAEMVIFVLILGRHWIARHWQECTVVVAVPVLAVAVFGSSTIRRIAEVRSVNYRLGYWASSWGVIKEHWLTGVGLENFRWSYTAHKAPWAGEVMYPHNSIIQSVAEFGIIGLVAFIAVWALFLIKILRAKTVKGAGGRRENEEPDAMSSSRLLLAGCIVLAVFLAVMILHRPFTSFYTSFAKGMLTVLLAAFLWGAVFAARTFRAVKGDARFLHAALTTGALGFLLHSMFDFGIYSYGVNQACWVVMALALAHTGAGGVKISSGKRLSSPAKLALTLIGCGALAFYMLGPLAMSLREETALDYVSDEQSKLPLTGERVPDIEVHNTETVRRLAWKYFRERRGLRPHGEKGDPRIADIAVRLMRRAIRLNPDDFRLHIETAVMLREIGRRAEALEEYNRAVELYPTRPSLRVYRAELLDRMGRREDARRDLEETARLLRLNRMPDGSVRHKTLELDTEKGLWLEADRAARLGLAPEHKGSPRYVSEEEIFKALWRR